MISYTIRRLLILIPTVFAAISFLFVLFFFTDASAWAQNYTSANRLVLHLVPTVFSLLAVVLATSTQRVDVELEHRTR